jgi:poly-gamma-glutamate biosynthesis protein PgsC/CapC
VVELALGLGIAVSLILSEAFGLASAGLVVPGYLALYLDRPARLTATVLVALLTWALVRYGFARVVVLYGRRRFGITILTGFVLNLAFARLVPMLPLETAELRAIGFIVPGLVANAALSQGMLTTLGITFLAAAGVRLLLVLLAYA